MAKPHHNSGNDEDMDPDQGGRANDEQGNDTDIDPDEGGYDKQGNDTDPNQDDDTEAADDNDDRDEGPVPIVITPAFVCAKSELIVHDFYGF